MARKPVPILLTATGLGLVVAAIVVAQGHPAPPAPPPAAPAVAVVPAVAPAVSPAPPAPPAPPRLRTSGRVHFDDFTLRFAGETIIVEEDGGSWVIDDPESVARMRATIEARTGDIERRVEALMPAIAPALAFAKEIEATIDTEALEALGRDIAASIDVEKLEALGREIEIEVSRAVEKAEIATRAAEQAIRANERHLREIEREMQRFERRMAVLESQIEVEAGQLERDVRKLVDEAIESGAAKKID